MWRLMVSRPWSAWMTSRAPCPNAATGRPMTRASAGARMSVPRVLSQGGVEVDLPLGNRHEHHEVLDADLRHGVALQRAVELPPALQVEHTLGLERQLPAALLVHRVAELVLTQSRGERRQLGPTAHVVDGAVGECVGPYGLVLRLRVHQLHLSIAIDRPVQVGPRIVECDRPGAARMVELAVVRHALLEARPAFLEVAEAGRVG